MVLPVIASAAKGLVSSTAKKKTASSMAQDAVSNYTKKREEKKSSSQKSTKPEETTTSSNYSYKKPKTPKVKIPKVKNESLKSSLVSLQKGLQGIVKNLKGLTKQKEKGDKEKKDRRRKVNKSLKEMGMEKISGVYSISKSIVNKIPFIDRIKKFFVNVLLGSIVTWLINNFETVVKVFTDIVKKIKEVFDLLNKYILTPIFEVGKFLVKTIWPIIEGIMKLPPVDGAIKEIEKLMGEFEKLIPGFESAKTKLEREKAKREGKTPPSEDGSTSSSGSSPAPPSGSGQYDTSSGGLLASGGIEQGEKAKEQVSQAGFGESEFTLYRDVVAQIESGGEYDIQGGSGNMYAGRYQMGAAAREDAARLLGETYEGDTEAARKKFREDPEMQERYFAAYTRANHETLMRLSPEYRELTKEGKLQVLGYAHNAGAGNAVKWLKSGRSESFRDGFNTRSDKYSTAIRKAQEKRKTQSSPADISGSGAVDTGLKTGPSQYIGGSSEYHIDAQFMKNQPMEQKVAMLDQMARGYATQGRKMEFSNQAVSGEVYDPDLPYEDKVKLIERAFGAHSHSRYSDRSSIDFYVPSTEQTRFGSSSEGAPLLAPSVRGGSMSYGSGGGYGNFVEVKDPDGNVIFRMGHGDTRYGRSSGTVQFEEQKPVPTPPAQQVSQLENPNTNLYELLTNPLVTEEIAMNTDNLQYSSDDVQMERPTTDSVARSVSKKASYEGQKVIAMFSLPTPQNNSTGAIVQKPSLSMSSGSSPQSNSNTYYKTLTIRNQYST